MWWQNRFMRRLATVWLSLLVMTSACVDVTPLPTTTAQPSSTATQTPPATSNPATPSARPTTAGPSGTPKGPAPTPLASIDPELAAQIDAVTAGVPQIRHIQPTADVPYEFISRDQFRDDLLDLNDEDVPPEIRAAEERMLKRLGLLPEDVNIDALIVELYGAQVAAYYRPDNGRFYIIERDQPFGASDKIVVAHEYTHALQDQQFDLDANTIKDPYQGDAQLAQVAAIEGDATVTSQLWATDNLTPDELFELLSDALGGLDQGSLDAMPLVLRRQLEFPYTEGFMFVNGLYDQGGFDAVNAAILTPPASTEQILHPEKYAAHEAPVSINLADMSASLGTGWSLAYQQTMGELGIQILATGGEEPDFAFPGLPVDWPHQEVAAGWAGDRLNMYENTDGRWLIVWETIWDTEVDQAEFHDRVWDVADTFDGFMTMYNPRGELNLRVEISSEGAVAH